MKSLNFSRYFVCLILTNNILNSHSDLLDLIINLKPSISSLIGLFERTLRYLYSSTYLPISFTWSSKSREITDILLLALVYSTIQFEIFHKYIYIMINLVLILNPLHHWPPVKWIPSHGTSEIVVALAVLSWGDAPVVDLQETTNRISKTYWEVISLKNGYA